jgi:cytochrome P450
MRLSHPTDSSAVDFSALDLGDARLYADGDPHLVWHALRERAPVYWQKKGEHGFWSVTRHADTMQVLRDHRAFTSERGTLLNILGVQDPAGGSQMAATDPPRHTQMRVPHNRAMSPEALARHADAIRAQVRSLLAPAADGETIDFAQGMMLLATGVAGELMGLPADDWPWLCRLLIQAIAPDDDEYRLAEGAAATLQASHRELFAYLQDHARQRRRSPGRDLISMLLTIRVNGEPLTPGSIVSNCYSILLGGMVTTPHVPTGTLMGLEGTGLYAEWAANPSLFDTAVEEALRYSSPVIHFMRYATADVRLRDARIAAGDAVVVWLASANRDEAAFPDPYRFDLRREPNRHVVFGYGPHYCVGHAAARATMRLLFSEMFRSFEGVEIAGPVRHLRSNFIGGLSHMPLRAHLGARAARPVLAAAG